MLQILSPDAEYTAHAGTLAHKIVDDWANSRSADADQVTVLKQALEQTKIVAVGCKGSDNAHFASAWSREGGTAMTAYHVLRKAKGSDLTPKRRRVHHFDGQRIHRNRWGESLPGVTGTSDPDRLPRWWCQQINTKLSQPKWYIGINALWTQLRPAWSLRRSLQAVEVGWFILEESGLAMFSSGHNHQNTKLVALPRFCGLQAMMEAGATRTRTQWLPDYQPV